MAKVTPLGIKRTCPGCGARFYDLNKNPATCPKCEHSYDPNAPVRTRRRGRTASAPAKMSEQDALLQHMDKVKKDKKKAAEAKDDEFEELDSGGDDALEELDDMDDIDALEEIEDIEEDEEMDDDITLDEDDVGAESLIDSVDDDDDDDDYDDDDDD